jgi:hypothetical protein
VKHQSDADETISDASSPWHDWYREYEAQWNAKLQPMLDKWPAHADAIRKYSRPTFVPAPAVVERFQAALEGDVKWLIGALRDERRKWFVADVAKAAGFLPNALFEPMLRASVEEPDKSFNRRFIKPCLRVYGLRRVNEYFMAVLESGDDFHKAGAVCALYWAGVGKEDEAHRDLIERKRKLFLETFVSNPNPDVRRLLMPSLCLDERAYPDTHKDLVARAIQIGREHPDDEVRQGVEVHLHEIRNPIDWA